MAIRIVYILPDKDPDILQEAVSWTFDDSTLKIWRKHSDDGPVIEIRRDVVFSVEHLAPAGKAGKAEKAPEEPEKALEEPVTALEGPVKAKRAPRKAKR